MRKDSASSASRPLLFLDDSPATARKRTISRQAKAHTARVNWERHKSKSIRSSSSADGSVAPRSQMRSPVIVPLPTTDEETLSADGYAGDPGPLSSTVSTYTGSPWSPGTLLPPASLAYALPNTTTFSTELLWPALSPPLSPVFGALTVNTFRVEQSVSVATTADYCFNVVLKNTLQPPQIASWFQAFSQSPVVFHALSYTVGVHQSLSGSGAATGNQQEMLMHKGQTIRTINGLLNDLDNADAEMMILAMFILWRVNVAQQTDVREETLLFSAYMPGANWISVYGKAQAIDMHAQALYWLVERIGGLPKIKLPGLQMVLSIGDLIDSSIRCVKPRFPCIWDVSSCLQVLHPILRSSERSISGTGFAHHVPRGLPARALETMQWLASIDYLMERGQHARLDDTFYGIVVSARNGIQHKILHLARWQELSETEREGSFFATYETCRITALIYANAVLFPMPPSTGWLLKLLDELRQLIEVSNLASWRDDTTSLLIWSLFIAAIASFRRVHRKFFRDALNTILMTRGIMSWSAAEAILKQFLWTDSACGQGGTIVWETMQMAAL
ncbi:hypothetical protein LTR53_007688 [Teratosphaeriaceae sp. CCFEE 6253]|nr:hypothetical protein LTR53_007688 [Teratosphaeriaceae sp. CCFEE 6253]